MTALPHLWRGTATAAQIHLALTQARVWQPDTASRTVSTGVLPAASEGGDGHELGQLGRAASHPGPGWRTPVPGAPPAAPPRVRRGHGGEVRAIGRHAAHLPATSDGTEPVLERLGSDGGEVRGGRVEPASGRTRLPALGGGEVVRGTDWCAPSEPHLPAPIPTGTAAATDTAVPVAQPGCRRSPARTARRGPGLNPPLAPAALPLIPALRRALADVVKVARARKVA
jgi:hypothetical protein